MQNRIILDLGCGENIHPNAIGVDIVKFPGIAVLCDLNQGIPFRSACANKVYCIHFLEHTSDLVHIIEEIYRVLKPGGLVEVKVPYFSSVSAIIDPTHHCFFSYRTFDYFSGTGALSYCSKVKFIVVQRKLTYSGRRKLRVLNSIINYFVNTYPNIYEQFLCNVIPVSGMYVQLMKKNEKL